MAITVKIQRGNGVYEGYEVPHREGMSVLDALKQIGHHVPDLAYRWECGQGICGVCTMMINGEPELACSALCKDGDSYTLDPVVGHPVEKDLLVNFTPRYDKMMEIDPFLVAGGEPIETKAEADESKLLRACIESWACVAVCPISLKTGNADALSMIKLARFALDPRDGEDRVKMAYDNGLELYLKTCPTCRACMDVCPKSIDAYINGVKVLADLAASKAENSGNTAESTNDTK